jgi:hypothetical protein
LAAHIPWPDICIKGSYCEAPLVKSFLSSKTFVYSFVGYGHLKH